MNFVSSEASPAYNQSPVVEDADQIPNLKEQYPEQTISQVEPYKPMEGAESKTEPVEKKQIDDGPQTDAELKLQEETEKAKKELIDQIKSFKPDHDDAAQVEGQDEPEDPRVTKFTVTNPVKVGGHFKYTVTGVDDEGEFTEQRRFREFNALS